MATTNRFQTRVLINDKTNNELRINSLLNQAENYSNLLNNIQINENEKNHQRKYQLDLWSKNLFEKIDNLYKLCLNDLKQSFEQLKLFQQIMIKILNINNENYLDTKKLLAIEHEICILRCLTYQLDTTKVKIDGKLKLSNNNHYEIFIDDDQNYQENKIKLNENKDFIWRILVQKDIINKIENLDIFQQFVKITTNQINQNTPERILTITGPNHFDVIETILSNIYSSSSSTTEYELRILLHQSYAPLILGKLGDRAKILREKYSLHTLTIYPICAPLSTERILLIQSLSIEKILLCIQEIFININQHILQGEDIIFYDEMNYDASLAHEYGGFITPEMILRLNEQYNEKNEEDQENIEEDEDDGIRRYSAFDAWNGSVEADTDHEFSVVKLADDSIIKEFWINHGQFGALLGPHGIRIAQIRSQCRTVRIHTVAGSSIDTCSVKVIGPRTDVNHAVNLIIQSIKEHDRKFPFKHHRFSGRLR